MWTGSNLRAKIHLLQKCYPCLRNGPAEIRLLNINDSNQNGVGIGLLIGVAALGILSGIAIKDETNAGGILAAALLGAGIGGGIGGLIGYVWDNQHKGTELIYRAPNNK